MDNPKRTLLFIIIIFFLVLLPVLPQITTYHSDERFYTDAAVYMAQHNDFLTPHYADGSLRLNKPIATYWILMASYAALGISYFSARLPFLLAGCLTLWLTYRMALTLFGRHRVGILAAAILAANVQFITLSLRATPDILQTLFLNVSLFGFCELLLRRDQRLRNHLFAYMGAALAVATKGFLGIAPVAFAFIYASFLKDRKDQIRRLLNPPVMLSAALLAVAWFVIMYLQHGNQELGRFYQDQVGERLIGPKYLFFINLKDYLWGFVRYFLPWGLVVLAGCWVCRNHVSAFFKAHQRPMAFIIGWTVLLLVIFCGGNLSRTRYLMPVYPLLAVLCATLFITVFHDSRIQRVWRWICDGLLVLLFFIGGLLTLGGWLLHWQLALTAVFFLCASAGGSWQAQHRKQVFSPLLVCLLILLSTVCAHALVLPVFQTAASTQVADTIMADRQIRFPVLLWAERRFKFAGQLYLISKGRIIPFHFPDGAPPAQLDQKPLILLSRKAVESMPLKGYTIIPCGVTSKPVKAADLWKAWQSGGRQAFFNALHEPCYLARRK